MKLGKIKSITKRLLRYVPDRVYIELYYFAKFRKRINLSNPRTFNEKLNWLKLNDKNPEYVNLVDKYEAKKIVGEKIGYDHIIPTLGLWDNFESINFDKLPDKFVLKCTHDSGGVVICHNKAEFNYELAKAKLNKSLSTNFFYVCREWPYKNIRPRIIAEEYMEDDVVNELLDYKFFCFHGKVHYMFIASGRSVGKTCFDYFDMDFNALDFKQYYPNSKVKPNKPVNWDEMIRIAEMLSKTYPHARVDFYEVNGRMYFGELTLYHFGGMQPFSSEKWDVKFGELLRISQT